jgi:hypothetical protein
MEYSDYDIFLVFLINIQFIFKKLKNTAPASLPPGPPAGP